MTPRAAAKERSSLLLAAVCLLSALLLAPAAEASRSLPAALAPVLEAPATCTASVGIERPLLRQNPLPFETPSHLDQPAEADYFNDRRNRTHVGALGNVPVD